MFHWVACFFSIAGLMDLKKKIEIFQLRKQRRGWKKRKISDSSCWSICRLLLSATLYNPLWLKSLRIIFFSACKVPNAVLQTAFIEIGKLPFRVLTIWFDDWMSIAMNSNGIRLTHYRWARKLNQNNPDRNVKGIILGAWRFRAFKYRLSDELDIRSENDNQIWILINSSTELRWMFINGDEQIWQKVIP